MLKIRDSKNPALKRHHDGQFQRRDCPALQTCVAVGTMKRSSENFPAFPSTWPSVYLVFQHGSYAQRLELSSFRKGCFNFASHIHSSLYCQDSSAEHSEARD